MQPNIRLTSLFVLSTLTLLALPAMAVTVITDNFDSGTASPAWDVNSNTAIMAGGAQGSANALRVCRAEPSRSGRGLYHCLARGRGSICNRLLLLVWE